MQICGAWSHCSIEGTIGKHNHSPGCASSGPDSVLGTDNTGQSSFYTRPSCTAETLTCSASLLCLPLLPRGWKEQSCPETALTFASFQKLPADEDNRQQCGEQRGRLSRGNISERGLKYGNLRKSRSSGGVERGYQGCGHFWDPKTRLVWCHRANTVCMAPYQKLLLQPVHSHSWIQAFPHSFFRAANFKKHQPSHRDHW